MAAVQFTLFPELNVSSDGAIGGASEERRSKAGLEPGPVSCKLLLHPNVRFSVTKTATEDTEVSPEDDRTRRNKWTSQLETGRTVNDATLLSSGET